MRARLTWTLPITVAEVLAVAALGGAGWWWASPAAMIARLRPATALMWLQWGTLAAALCIGLRSLDVRQRAGWSLVHQQLALVLGGGGTAWIALAVLHAVAASRGSIPLAALGWAPATVAAVGFAVASGWRARGNAWRWGVIALALASLVGGAATWGAPMPAPLPAERPLP